MNDKELAEKVAEYFGATNVSEKTVKEYALMGLLDRNKEHDKYWDFEFTELAFHLCPSLELEEVIFSWPVTGLIIEKMESMESLGWDIHWDSDGIEFQSLREHTSNYLTVEHGYHKAISLAFVEAMEIINNEK
jgi:hypothetical protein